MGAALAGFGVGAATVALLTVWLVSFGRTPSMPAWMTPAKAAGLRRSCKLIIFPVGGVIVANAAFWSAEYFAHQGSDPQVANALGLMIGAVAGGAHQAATWQANAPPIVPVSPLIPYPPAASYTLSTSSVSVTGGSS